MNSNLDDAGEYKVKAKNSLGSVSAVSDVNIIAIEQPSEDKDSKIKLDHPSTATDKDSNDLTAKSSDQSEEPVFVSIPESTSCMLGDTFQLKCRVAG